MEYENKEIQLAINECKKRYKKPTKFKTYIYIGKQIIYDIKLLFKLGMWKDKLFFRNSHRAIATYMSCRR